MNPVSILTAWTVLGVLIIQYRRGWATPESATEWLALVITGVGWPVFMWLVKKGK